MTDRHHAATTADLERLLDDIRGQLEFPDTIGIADAVRQRISMDSTTRSVRRRVPQIRRDLLVAALVLLVVTVALVVAVPGSRHAVADWLGLRGVSIEHPGRPKELVPAGTDLQLGRRTTLEDARASVDFPVTIPLAFGEPDAVYLARGPAGGRVSLLYAPDEGLPAAGRDDVGLLVTEFTARIDEGVLGKVLAVEGNLEPVTVDGSDGYWISDGPHIVGLLDRNGDLYRDSTRLAADTLLIQDGDRIIRIESALSKPDVIALARTLLRQ